MGFTPDELKKIQAALDRAAYKAIHGTPEERSGRFTLAQLPPLAKMPLATAPAAYAGDNISVSVDRGYLRLHTGLGTLLVSLETLAAINAYAAHYMPPGESLPAGKQHNVYCEETKKHHLAVLVRELTLDEIYKGLK